MNKWLNNTADDIWYGYSGEFDTKEEAIQNGIRQYKDWLNGCGTELFDDYEDEPVSFLVGQQYPFEPYADEELVLESAINQAYDEGFEDVYDYWLHDITKEQQEELHDMLQSALDSWMKKNKFIPNFYLIKNVEEIIIEDYL